MASFPRPPIPAEFRAGRQRTRAIATCHSPLASVLVEESPQGSYYYRRKSYPQGAFRAFPTRVDMLLGFIAEELGLALEFGGIKILEGYCKIHSAQISRARANVERIPESWIFRLHQFSGIPLAELFALAGMSPVSPHPNARKETP